MQTSLSILICVNGGDGLYQKSSKKVDIILKVPGPAGSDFW